MICVLKETSLTNEKCPSTWINPNNLKKLFSQEKNWFSHTLFNSPEIKTTHHKHLGLILNEKLDFKKHLRAKAYKGIKLVKA